MTLVNCIRKLLDVLVDEQDIILNAKKTYKSYPWKHPIVKDVSKFAIAADVFLFDVDKSIIVLEVGWEQTPNVVWSVDSIMYEAKSTKLDNYRRCSRQVMMEFKKWLGSK
jgi:hypothetical protein